MIYLTNDVLDQAVYFEFRGAPPRLAGNGREERYAGLVGNGIFEVPVTLKSWQDRVEVEFGHGDLFSFVEEDAVRRILGDVLKETTVH